MTTAFGASLKTWLEQRNPRERQLFLLVAVVIGLALLWWVAIAPALQTYRQSSAAHAKLDAQIAAMQVMADESKRLKAKPRVSAVQAQNWLEGAVKKLNKATLTVQGSRVQINFTDVPADALAAWLAEARTSVQLLPVEANWKKSVSPSSLASAVNPLWGGALVFELLK
jgi:general secretion pathway protein M